MLMQELRRARIEFEAECDAIERDCENLARLLTEGKIGEIEFDEQARAILGEDYEERRA